MVHVSTVSHCTQPSCFSKCQSSLRPLRPGDGGYSFKVCFSLSGSLLPPSVGSAHTCTVDRAFALWRPILRVYLWRSVLMAPYQVGQPLSPFYR